MDWRSMRRTAQKGDWCCREESGSRRTRRRILMKKSGYIASTPPPSLDDYRTEAGKGIYIGGRRSSGAPASLDAAIPLVSVITIVRNGVTVLSRAIESVLSQDYRNVDYVVVDGQSTDGTLGAASSITTYPCGSVNRIRNKRRVQ
jgi:hypothetical protein